MCTTMSTQLESQTNSTPPASKVHCSINGLENSSSTEYSKVQHLFGIAVGLFPVGGGLFFCYSRTQKKSYSDRKKSSSNRKKSSSDQKSPPPTQKSPTLTKKVFLIRKKYVLPIPKKYMHKKTRNPFKKESCCQCRSLASAASTPPLGDPTLPLLHHQHNLKGKEIV